MILLDTHAALWLSSEPARLSPDAKAAIQDARRRADSLAICDISLLELTTIAIKGRILLGVSLESVLEQLAQRFTVLPISVQACAKIQELPANYPKDPADRIIGATALAQALPLITADREIRRSKAIHTIW